MVPNPRDPPSTRLLGRSNLKLLSLLARSSSAPSPSYFKSSTTNSIQAWTANPQIYPIVPILAGLPFGIGFLLIFVALTNYLTNLYADQAASAMAALTCTRSICGAGLPFATQMMYATLGVHWAGSLLGFLALLVGMVPWVFWRWGARIRGRGSFAK
jgi:hypothetical protein